MSRGHPTNQMLVLGAIATLRTRGKEAVTARHVVEVTRLLSDPVYRALTKLRADGLVTEQWDGTFVRYSLSERVVEAAKYVEAQHELKRRAT